MDIKLPKLGEGADSGVVVNLLVQAGDTVRKDQPLIELENEKAVAAIPAPAAGIVTQLHVKVGDKVSVGQRIATMSDASDPASPAAPSTTAPAPAPVATPVPAAPSGAAGAVVNPNPSASPSLRRLAAELGIDLTRVAARAQGGRLVMSDLRAFIEQLRTQAAAPAPSAPAVPATASESVDFSRWGKITTQPMSSLRKVISRRMTSNWNAIPHVTQFDEADITDFLALRKKFAAAYEAKGARLTLTPFAIKAVVSTLKRHPIFNSSLDEAAAAIVLKEYFHIGIAVDTDAGLIVPVIRDADRKNLLELAAELELLANKARERKLGAEELQGGSFTISNQGGIGGAHFTPIVNRPEVAILGLGRGAAKPVARDGQVVLRTMLPLAVSYDHRVIDGGTAARFITDLVQAFQSVSEADFAI